MIPTIAIYALDQGGSKTSSTGIFHYTRNLIAALADQADPGFRVRILVSRSNAAALLPPELPAWMTACAIPGDYATGARRLLADHVLAPCLALRHQVALLHYPKGYVSICCPGRTRILATMHDAIIDHYARRWPGALPRAKQHYLLWLTRHSLKRADFVVTDSDYSRGELAALVPAAASRIAVVPFGPGIAAKTPSICDVVRAGLLVLGSRFPHKATKETLHLLAAYARRAPGMTRVTVTGLTGWPAEWGPPPIGVATDFVGRVSDAELAHRMASSRALVLLSEIEGFGLPAIESYAAGTPVCYRATTSLREIMAGVPGGWTGATAHGFFEALDEVLALPRDRIEEIRARLAARFNWNQAAMRMLELYRNELSALPPP